MRLFEQGTKLLPGFCKAYPDELLTSWLTRLAHNHGMGMRELYQHIWPDHGPRIDIDSYIDHEQINQLALATNCSEDEVWATTLLGYRGNLYYEDRSARQGINWMLSGTRRNKWHTGSQYSTGLMFCPKCLINDGNAPYFRKQWRLATSLICECCGYFLIDNCPACHHGNSFLNIGMGIGICGSLSETMIGCHTCGINITEAKAIPAPWSVRRLQGKLNELVAGISPHPEADARSYLRVLYHLSSLLLKKSFADRSQQRFVQQVLASNGLDQSCIERSELALIRKAPVQTRCHVIGAICWLLDKWPYRIETVCREAKVTFYDVCSFIPQAPKWFTQPLQERLEGIARPPAPSRESRFVALQSFNRASSYSHHKPEIELPLNELDYDLDFDDMYYTNCNIKYYAYEDLQSECSTYENGADPEEYEISELALRPRYRSEEVCDEDAIVYDYL